MTVIPSSEGYTNEALEADCTSDVVSKNKSIKQHEEFNKELSYCQPENNGKIKIKSFKRLSNFKLLFPAMDDIIYKIKSTDPIGCVKDMFPVLNWLPKYSIKSDLPGDLISGLTVAVMHIPQGEYIFLSTITSRWF